MGFHSRISTIIGLHQLRQSKTGLYTVNEEAILATNGIYTVNEEDILATNQYTYPNVYLELCE